MLLYIIYVIQLLKLEKCTQWPQATASGLAASICAEMTFAHELSWEKLSCSAYQSKSPSAKLRETLKCKLKADIKQT